MSDSNSANSAAAQRGSSWLGWILIALAIVAYFAMRARGPEVIAELVGIARPPLAVAGWLNTNAPPSDESLRGQVVLLDCWFVDCPPCRAAMPGLADFYRRYRDQGVVVIGITPDAGSDVPRLEEFVKSVPGFDWPVGYGADVPLGIMEIDAYPTLILFDKTGKSVWAGHSLNGVDGAVVKALASEKSS